jgi:large subunit ribosomal protein L10
MAVTKAKKAEQIEKLNQDLQKASSMIVGTFSKLTVSKDFELRKTVRTAGGRYQVVKNTLAKRASEGAEGAERRHVDCLHQRRPGRTGQGAQQVR